MKTTIRVESESQQVNFVIVDVDIHDSGVLIKSGTVSIPLTYENESQRDEDVLRMLKNLEFASVTDVNDFDDKYTFELVIDTTVYNVTIGEN